MKTSKILHKWYRIIREKSPCLEGVIETIPTRERLGKKRLPTCLWVATLLRIAHRKHTFLMSKKNRAHRPDIIMIEMAHVLRGDKHKNKFSDCHTLKRTLFQDTREETLELWHTRHTFRESLCVEWAIDIQKVNGYELLTSVENDRMISVVLVTRTVRSTVRWSCCTVTIFVTLCSRKITLSMFLCHI